MARRGAHAQRQMQRVHVWVGLLCCFSCGCVVAVAAAATAATPPTTAAAAAAAVDATNVDVNAGTANHNRQPGEDAFSQLRPNTRRLPHVWKDTDLGPRLQPELIGIGCQKCGTTSLFYYLQQLPWVVHTWRKEQHFFDRGTTVSIDINSRYQQAKILKQYKHYLRRWPNVTEATTCTLEQCHVNTTLSNRTAVDISPMYLSDRRSPWSLHEVLPHAAQVKLVLQIRDPVTRTLSGFRQGSPGDTVDEFAAVTSTELHLLHHCYNSSLQLAHPSPKTTGDSSNPFGITCNTGHHQYAALYRCVSALAESADGKALTQDRPWFQHFTRKGNKELLQQHVSLKLLKKYEGHVHRSIYVDQLINFLCAGFRPDQFIVVTTTELKADAEGVLHRIATALDRPSQLAAQARKRVLSGIHANMHRHSHTMPDAMERELQEFFQPYNQRLLDVLDFYGFVFNRTAMIHELNLQQ